MFYRFFIDTVNVLILYQKLYFLRMLKSTKYQRRHHFFFYLDEKPKESEVTNSGYIYDWTLIFNLWWYSFSPFGKDGQLSHVV